MNKISTEIIGTGLYVPGEAISNEELIELTGVEFDTQKFEKNLGYKSRHIAKYRGINETTADFCEKASLDAIKNSGIDVCDIGLVIVGTDTPEYISPATAVVLQGRIQKGQKWTTSFDVNAGCASFGVAYDNAVRILATDNTIKYALVVGVYNMPAFIHDDSRFTVPIFSDGAGAIIIKNNTDTTYIGSKLLTDGTQFDYIGIYKGGANHQVTKDDIENKKYGLESLQPLPGDRNVKLWPEIIKHLTDKYEEKIEDVDHFIFTQINASVINQVMEIIGHPLSKTTIVTDKYGYTGSGCIPMAFHHAVIEGRVKKGDKVIFVASGAGLSVASNFFIY